MTPQQDAPRDTTRPFFDGLSLSLLAMGVVMFVIMAVQQHVRREAADRQTFVAAAARDLRFDLASAHLAVEEYGQGDPGIDPAQDVDSRYAHALRLLDQLTDESSDGGAAALLDPLIADRIGKLGTQVGELRDLARLRVSQGTRAPRDATLDRQFDNLLRVTSLESQAIAESLNASAVRAGERLDTIEVIVDAIVAVLFIAGAILVARQRRAHRDEYQRLESRAEGTARDAAVREARARALLNSSIDAIVTANAGGEIVGCNPAAERLFGYTEAEMLGRQVREFTGEPYRSLPPERFAEYYQRALASPRGVSEIVAGRRKDGREMVLDMSLSAVTSGDEATFMAILRDIGDRVAAEQRFQ
ncbi:MAG: PAS domain S-box protein, partial [Gemmatimonadaceae bacterium]|nr:PAS domain S-box protein [Gemmatimonadaceae bacterium]